MQKVLITGANGFVGYYLVQQLLELDYYVIATGKGESRLPFSGDHFIYVTMDFTDPQQVQEVFDRYSPDVVVHSGAISKPDECEQNQTEAYRINVKGTQIMIAEAEKLKSFLIYISTDFVFSGTKEVYTEEDEGDPVNYYGQTKLEAEQEVKHYAYAWSIVRTILVYGKPFQNRQNILTNVANGLRENKPMKIFYDQTRTPTYVEDLAKGIVQIIQRKKQGIFHLSGTDIRSPYQMAVAVAEHLGYDPDLITRVTAGEFAQPARRPARTVFDLAKAKKELDYVPISFEEGLRRTFGLEGSE